MPTRKWWPALITGAGGIAVMALSTGSWGTEESIALTEDPTPFRSHRAPWNTRQ